MLILGGAKKRPPRRMDGKLQAEGVLNKVDAVQFFPAEELDNLALSLYRDGLGVGLAAHVAVGCGGVHFGRAFAGEGTAPSLRSRTRTSGSTFTNIQIISMHLQLKTLFVRIYVQFWDFVAVDVGANAAASHSFIFKCSKCGFENFVKYF